MSQRAALGSTVTATAERPSKVVRVDSPRPMPAIVRRSSRKAEGSARTGTLLRPPSTSGHGWVTAWSVEEMVIPRTPGRTCPSASRPYMSFEPSVKEKRRACIEVAFSAVVPGMTNVNGRTKNDAFSGVPGVAVGWGVAVGCGVAGRLPTAVRPTIRTAVARITSARTRPREARPAMSRRATLHGRRGWRIDTGRRQDPSTDITWCPATSPAFEHLADRLIGQVELRVHRSSASNARSRARRAVNSRDLTVLGGTPSRVPTSVRESPS